MSQTYGRRKRGSSARGATSVPSAAGTPGAPGALRSVGGGSSVATDRAGRTRQPSAAGPVVVTVAIENYLKQIDELSSRGGGQKVSAGLLAQSLDVTPGTVTAMLRRLADAGLASYERYGGVALTRRGRTEARRVTRRHRIIEVFLVEVLGLDWAEVHDEAERLEHALSDKVLERIDAMVKRPTVDPHGDPIPGADGSIAERSLTALADCRPGVRAAVARVMDQAPGFLRFADAAGLRPGAVLDVLETDRAGESLSFRIGRAAPRTISLSAAWKVMVEPKR
jgi:DtxR family Mn-dependent transcriptional regulator